LLVPASVMRPIRAQTVHVRTVPARGSLWAESDSPEKQAGDLGRRRCATVGDGDGVCFFSDDEADAGAKRTSKRVVRKRSERFAQLGLATPRPPPPAAVAQARGDEGEISRPSWAGPMWNTFRKRRAPEEEAVAEEEAGATSTQAEAGVGDDPAEPAPAEESEGSEATVDLGEEAPARAAEPSPTSSCLTHKTGHNTPQLPPKTFQVGVVGVENVAGATKDVLVYVVEFRVGSRRWTVKRRWNQFVEFHQELKSSFPRAHIGAECPYKAWLPAGFKEVKGRQQLLQGYVQGILAIRRLRQWTRFKSFFEFEEDPA